MGNCPDKALQCIVIEFFGQSDAGWAMMAYRAFGLRWGFCWDGKEM
jgi:hypothetical protein